MTLERWNQIQKIFQEAAELSESQRPHFLDGACNGDPELLREVESLFCFDQGQRTGAHGLSGVIGKAATSLMFAESMAGRRLGAYRIIRQLGAGGMGAVYLAVRDDAEFDKEVAIKVGRGGFGTFDTDVMREHFRRERQILARLEHPYIGKLLDGGTTPEGAPYFIMEYIEGQTIVDYAASQRLNIEKKCELFAQVCEAVAYAHGNLVIHRDLKPSNILMNKDGVPKLLDFGISKLMTPDHGEMTMLTQNVGSKLMTPDYASPEQVRGEPFNTTTDVYSLGAVLFELLTNERPHEIRGYTTTELEYAICTAEARKPSSVVTGAAQRRLRGDLDNIVLMAMRKEPQRRYQSASDLREDILRHLKGLPVRAREESSLYIAGKFLRRHRVAAAAATIVFFGLGAGIISTNYEWRKAEEARQVAEAQRQTAEQQRRAADSERSLADSLQSEAEVQRDVALRAQQQADQRLQQFLGLANETLFKFDEQIASLPGATQVRRDNVKVTLRYLDQLAKDAGEGDPRVDRLLVSGYISLGMVQSAHGRSNVGDAAGSLVSFHKAETILTRLLRANPNEPALLKDATRLYEEKGQVLDDQNRHAEGIDTVTHGLQAAERLAALKPHDKEALSYLADVHHVMAQLSINLDKAAATLHSEKEMALFEQLVAAYPSDTKLLNGQISAFMIASEMRHNEGKIDETITYLRKAVAVREELVQQMPNDARLQRNLLMAYGRLGDNLGGPYLVRNAGDSAGAVEAYRKSMALARRLVAADAADSLAQSDLATILSRLGMALEDDRSLDESVTILQNAEAIAKRLLATDAKRIHERVLLTNIYETLGHRFERRGNNEEALKNYRASLEITETLLGPTDAVGARREVHEDYRALGMLLGSMGRRSEALQYGDKAVAFAEKLQTAEPNNNRVLILVPMGYETAGLVYLSVAKSRAGVPDDYNQARHWFTRARDTWTQYEGKPALRGSGDVARLNAKLAECDQALLASARTK